MPVYSGTKQVEKGSWSIPAEEREWSKVEWRYYEAKDSVKAVTTFCRAQMPALCLGEHNEFVCTQLLGMSDEEFVGLMAEGVFD